MYEMSGSLNTTTSMLSQLMVDASGELLQSLQSGLQEAVERTAAGTANMGQNTPQREIAESLPPVFETAQGILDKAALRVTRARQAR